jgi:hypothetical protein
LRQVPPAETGGAGGAPFGGAGRIGSVAECKFVREFEEVFELAERGLMNGRVGASMADTGSPRCWRIAWRPERISLSSFVSSERCSKDGGWGDREET